MSRKIAFIFSHSGSITAVANGKSYTVQPDHRYYNEIKEDIKNDDVAGLEKHANVQQAVHNYLNTGGANKVDVRDGVVYYGGEAVHNTLTERILNFMTDGLPFEPLVKFLENLMLNPSKRSVDQLYPFLEHQGIPITDDGCFLAYKRVRDDWMDFHSGKVCYKVGNVVKIDRNKVDDDPNSACSYGLHVGALGYVENFNSGGHIVICKVKGSNVVSIPHDSSSQKLRCCELEVIGEYTGVLSAPLYSGMTPWQDTCEDDDYEEDYWPEDDDDFDDDDTDLEDDYVEAELVEEDDECK